MNNIKNLLNIYNLTPKKKLGQNFLKDEHVLKKIIAAADITENDTVLEIGAGLGTLTSELLNCKCLFAIELDTELVKILKSMFININIIQGDILKIDLPTLLHGHENIKVIANLPYYITTPIILYLLESGINFNSIIIMIQKEVAKRLTASPGTKDYGSLTLAVGYYSNVELIANVPSHSFIPRPNVDSAVIKLTLLEKPRVNIEKGALFKIIHAAFNQRRKTLVNAIMANMSIEKYNIISVIEDMGLDKNIRGEMLDIFQFAKIAESLL